MTYNRTITKAAEIISAALVGAGIAADGWAMQIIGVAPIAADADRYTVAVYQPRHRIPSTVWALTIDTAHDGWTIAARTMECTYNRDTVGAEYAPHHALASAMTGRIRITAPDAYAAHLAELEAAEPPETAPAAEPEAETAETETAERAAEINPMCTDCTRRGTDCDGTTCKSFTGCIYRIGLGSSKRDETPAHITDATTAKLLDYWDCVRRLSYSAATAITRGWILDEIERRDPVGYVRWVDDDTLGDYDARLRDFIRCDDAHVAWLCPQTATTWHPGDTREGARV